MTAYPEFIRHKYKNHVFFVIPLRIFPYDILVSTFYKDLDKAINEIFGLKLNKEEKESLLNRNPEGRMTCIGSTRTAITLKKKPKTIEGIGVLVHEMSHAVKRIFNIIHAEHNEETEEFFCYTLEYLVEQALLAGFYIPLLPQKKIP